MATPPKLDTRTYEQLVEQTSALAQQVTAWKPRADGQPDAGQALIRIFGRMAALVSDRLNQVPAKNFLAFLDLIGTQIYPPQPAKAPLTFYLATGRTQDAFVPARTQVAAPATETELDEVIFETDRELVVTPAQLAAVCVRVPDMDQFDDYTAIATGQTAGSFPTFAAQQPIEHALYIAADELLTIPGSKTLTLTLQTSDAPTLQIQAETNTLIWACWNGHHWQPCDASTRTDGDVWHITLTELVAPQPIEIDGVTATWLRMQWMPPLPPDAAALPLPELKRLSAAVRVNQTNLVPDQCFCNGVPLDISKDFYPFGEQPRFNDTFYIASQNAFSQGGKPVTVQIALSPGLPQPEGTANLAWEAWTGNTWEPLTVTLSAPSNFKESGAMVLTLPEQIAPKEVNGVSNYWVRARLIRGNYGEAAAVTAGTTGVVAFRPATYQPPSLQSLRLSYDYTASSEAIACRTDNDFVYTNPNLTIVGVVTGAASSQASIQMVRLSQVDGLTVGDRLRVPAAATGDAHDYTIQALYPDSRSVVLDRPLAEPIPTAGTEVFRYFPLFQSTADRHPALYLGFDRPFSPRPMTLYAQVEPLPATAAMLANQVSTSEPPQLVWEYYGVAGWTVLGAQDETRTLSQRGLIQFIGPPDSVARSDFGQSPLYWLRARWASGQFRIPPRLQQICTNTIWASQLKTLTDEILGSSTGNPNQRFQTTQFPVLAGQTLEIREAQLPSLAEQTEIRRLEGDNALTLIQDDGGPVEGGWVRWHEVPDFYGSGGRDRHYVLNHLTGEVQFGDGQRGLIPPLGLNNIRLSQYCTGGGETGNRPAQTITQIKTTVPYIDRVTNLESATGGAPQESLEQVQRRGPRQLRHRGRAVTAQDFEDLALEASPDVARAKAIVPTFDALGAATGESLWIDPGQVPTNQHRRIAAGRVALLIVPRSHQSQPVPSLALIEQVERFIATRCLPTLSVQVGGPPWVEVTVTADIVLASLAAGDAVRSEIVNQLNRFLHPLKGGTDGRGWDFGRRPHRSDFYALIEPLAGVVRVRSLQITPDVFPGDSVAHEDSDSQESSYLIFPGTHQIRLVAPAGGA